MLRIGQKMSDLHLETTEGDMRAHEYFNGRYLSIFTGTVQTFENIPNNNIFMLLNTYNSNIPKSLLLFP